MRRVEVAVPILEEELKQIMEESFVTMWSDNVKARVMQPDGSYVRKSNQDADFCAQEFFLN